MESIDVHGAAILIRNNLDEHFDSTVALHRQVLCMAEETGEFIQAYRRWAGLARQSGSKEAMEKELADIIITAYVTAVVLNIDIEARLEDNLHNILTRGWKQWEETPSNSVS